MKVTIEGTTKEIAALVQELQERQMVTRVERLELEESGIQLCANDILEDK